MKVKKYVPQETYKSFSKLCFHILLPIYLFNNIYTADLGKVFNAKFVVYIAVLVMALIGLGFVFSKVFIKNKKDWPVLIQNFYRSNIGIIGISLAANLSDKTGIEIMSLALTVLVPLYNLMAVVIFELCCGEGKISTKALLYKIFTNGFVVAGISAILCVVLKIKLPSFVVSTVGTLGRAGSAVAILALGADFDFSQLSKNFKKLTFQTLLRLVIIPLFVIVLSVLFGFRGNELAVILIVCATPYATNCYTMCLEYDSDYELAGQIVVSTSFFCCFTLFIWIFILKTMGLI